MVSKIIAVLSLFVLSIGLLQAQEVIMNVPSADVVGSGHIFMRADSFYTQNPAYFSENANFAVGLGHGLEVSTNFADMNHGISYITPGFKWQAYQNKSFTFYVGDQVTAPIAARSFGNNSYEAAAYTTHGFRLTGGSFQSTNATQAGNSAGFLAGLELPAKLFRSGWGIQPGLDWSSGRGSNGYTSLGVNITKKNFFISPGYMIGNPHSLDGAHQSFVMIGFTL